MQSFKMKATVVLAAIAVIVIFAFMSTDIECCEKPDRKLQESMFAGQNGNLDEIRVLYAKAKMDEIPALEKYWALEGALKGDPESGPD